MSAGLDAHLVVRRDDGFVLDLPLTVAPGETVALLGPNGAGKSTAVAAVAGLVPLDGGRLVLDGRVLDEPAADVLVPPAERRIGVVFQRRTLFPHLSAVDNVAFGIASRGVGRRAARREAREWLDRLDLGLLADRRADRLSGGQDQQVALVRALASEPELLVLDEPLSALDVTVRGDVRRFLARHLADFAGPRLLITHDPTEAFLLADRVHVVEDGRLTQAGTVDEIRRHPETTYAADLVGVNLLAGTAAGGVVDVDGFVLVVADDPVDGPVLASVHPRAVALHLGEPEGSARNAWRTTVVHVEDLGTRSRVLLGDPLAVTAEVTPTTVAQMGLSPGTPVWASVKATQVRTHRPERADTATSASAPPR